MSLEFSHVQVYKGFELAQTTSFSGSIMVVTGLNGAGKSRFLEAIANRCVRVEDRGKELLDMDIKLLSSSNLDGDVVYNPYVPNFIGNYDSQKEESKLSDSIKLYSKYHDKLDSQKINGSPPSHPQNKNVFRFNVYHKACRSIALKLNVKPSSLTPQQITFHWEEPAIEQMGNQNISYICNLYRKKIELNEYNEFLSLCKKKDVIFYDREKFVDIFGPPPWNVLNDIIQSITDGKFSFNIPVDDEVYSARLMEVKSGKVISINDISSGEKTLIWFAITLFNAQYYDVEMKNSLRLLLLDEPDAFLHPKMVAKMFSVLDNYCKIYNTVIVFTTHSPTTVALSPENSTYILEDSMIKNVSKDSGVIALLDGVNQITINPENRRQVYVESHYDADVYQLIYSHLLFETKFLPKDISLSFISSGPKLPKQRLIDQARKFFSAEDELIENFVKAINGEGTCDQVLSQVEALVLGDNKTVRGIVDWDHKNKSTSNISVLAEGYAYTIENLLLDPICIFLLLHIDYPDEFPMDELCGTKTTWQDWLCDKDLLQNSMNIYIKKIFGRDNEENCDLVYLSGLKLKSDKEYLLRKGHTLENLVVETFPKLKSYQDRTKNNPKGEGSLKKVVTNRIMKIMTKGEFIPMAFKDVMLDVLK